MAAVAVVWLAFTAVVYVLESWTHNKNAAFYETFVQLCFSSWPSQSQALLGRHSTWFAAGVALRLILIIGPFVGIVGILEALLQRRRFTMRYIELLLLRDQAIKDRFLTLLPVPDESKEQFRQLYERAVAQGTQDLREDLEILVGKEEAQVLMSAGERTI